MPKDITSEYRQKLAELESDEDLECYILDLASVHSHVSFNASSKQIISRDRVGCFPTTRIKVGDSLEITGTANNNKTVTVTDITSRVLTVSESLTDESTVFTRFTNYQYYIKYLHDVYFFKMSADQLTSTNMLYTAANVRREEIKNSSDGSTSLKISIQNVDRVMEGFIQDRTYLRGCNLFVINAFREHFPSGGDYKYIGTNPDRLSHVIDRLKIDTSSSDNNYVTFECRPKFMFRSVKLPRRMISSTHCAWAEEYGGEDCDPDGTNINYTLYPTCDGTMEACRERGNIKRIGLFPGIPKQAIYIR